MCRENVNKLIHLFLLALFLSYYGSITFFSHYHVVNGVTIVHSHFFCGHADTDGKADHTHSPKDGDFYSETACAWSNGLEGTDQLQICSYW